MKSSPSSSSLASNRGWLLRGAALLVGCGVLVAACGDDGEEPPPPVVPTTVTSGNGGSGGSTTATTTGNGGMDMGLGCETDGRCESGEHCSCPDCWYAGDVPNCLSTANCFDDGVCDNSSDNNRKEGCHCPDCADRPECTDYCLSCQTKLTFNPNTDALCGDSAPIFEDLRACACDPGSLCISECGSFCQGSFPTTPCLDCLKEDTEQAYCETEYDACVADIKPRNRCNPISGAPCNLVGNERCDRRIHGDAVVGFECFLQNAGATTCESCTYSIGSTTYCGQGNTCIDPTNAPTAGGTCGSFCCDSGDCGNGAACNTGAFAPAAPGLGTCELSTTPTDPECTAPDPVPSDGSCVTVESL